MNIMIKNFLDFSKTDEIYCQIVVITFSTRVLCFDILSKIVFQSFDSENYNYDLYYSFSVKIFPQVMFEKHERKI